MQHDVTIDPVRFERIRLNERLAQPIWLNGRDFQAGDTVRFWRNDTEPEYRYSTERTITHVQPGGEDGIDKEFVVLSLADPRVATHARTIADLRDEVGRLIRSNSALRGRARRLAEQVKS